MPSEHRHTPLSAVVRTTGDLHERDLAAWRRLADRAAEPNPFFHPDFVLSACETDGSEAALLVVPDESGDEWVACLPLERGPRWRRLRVACLRPWREDLVYLATPLVDAARVRAGASALAALVAGEREAAAAILAPLSPDGTVGAALVDALTELGRAPVVHSEYERAALRRRPTADYVEETLSRSHRKQLRRRRRGLEEALGAELNVTDRSDDPAAWETFLALEAQGWKGDEGTALGCSDSGRDFFLSMCSAFAARGRLQLLALEAGGRTVAMQCNLRCGNTLFGFKVAYDHSLARFAPGVQLEVMAIETFHSETDAVWIDSCAAADNEVVNRIWPDRVRVATLVVPTGARRAALVKPVARAEAAGRRVMKEARARRASMGEGRLANAEREAARARLAAPRERAPVAGRVARAAGVRAAAEIVGKFSSLALLAVLAREEGAHGLGVFVFALAWCEVATTPVEMGLDRYFLRRVSADLRMMAPLFFNIVGIKLVRALVLVPVAWLALTLLGSTGDTRAVVVVLSVAFLCESFMFTVSNALIAHERGDLVGIALAVQRLIAAGLGIALLLLGEGIVGVAFAYAIGVASGLVTSIVLLARHVGLPPVMVPASGRRELRRESLPFAWQEVLGIAISRVDVFLLSAFMAPAAVGLYGAAYRLLEATLFVSNALQGAFSAMYAYLGEKSRPTIREAFGGSIKLLVVLLTPLAVPLAAIPGALLEMFFGPGFDDAINALRVLGPTVILVGIVLLGGALMSARLDARLLGVFYAVALVVNVAFGVVLIPALGVTGAALAMLATELVFAFLVMFACVRAVGSIGFVRTGAGALVGGGAMAAALLALQGLPLVALLVGGVVYVGGLLLVEKRVAPDDVSFALGALRRRLPEPLAARI